MSGSIGTVRAGTNRQSGVRDKMAKSERSSTSQQQQQQTQSTSKTEVQQSNKMQPTQEQLRLAQITNTYQSDVVPAIVKELMELTGKGEEEVIIALHDAEYDANRAGIMLIEGGNEQKGEWREQGGKRKKKVGSSQKELSNHVGDENFEGCKDRGDREEKEVEGGSNQELPPRRGRRNAGPPPRFARGRARDRGSYGDRENRERNAEEYDGERGEERWDRSGSDRGRSSGRGGYGGRRFGGRGRFNNSNDRDGRGYNHVPRFERMNNQQPVDGPEIDTWTNETAEKKTSKDTDWNNWQDLWVNEEDQWTGSLEETKVFTPSQMKAPEPETALAEPSAIRGQRVDVGSLFIESAKYSKAPDYSKPSGDAYINQFKQVATESIKNTIGIGSSSRPPQSFPTSPLPNQSISNSMGLSSLSQSSGQVQISALSQQDSQIMSHLSQQQVGLDQTPSAQSRVPFVAQQQNVVAPPTTVNINMQQRPKQQKSKLPPPSKIPASAVEMPGHIPRNPQLDLQFGIDFGTDSGTTFGFGDDSESVEVTNTYAAPTNTYTAPTNGTSSVIANHMSQSHMVQSSSDGSSLISSISSSPSSGSTKLPSAIEPQQSVRQPATGFQNSVYAASPPMNDSQNLDREQNKINASENNSYSSQLEHRSSPVLAQRTTQNLGSGSLSQSKSEASSGYTAANGYTPPSYQKSSAISQAQTYTHSSVSQTPQSSTFQGQYATNQTVYPSSGQTQFSNPANVSQFTPSGQHTVYNSVQNQYTSSQNQYTTGQNQYTSGQNQYTSAGPSSHPALSNVNHQPQYGSGIQTSYTSPGQSQYQGYHSSSNSSYSSHPTSQTNFPSSNQTSGTNSSVYSSSTQPTSPFTSQTVSNQSPTSGSYLSKETQGAQSASGVAFQSATQSSSSLKPASSQTNTNYNSQSFSTPSPLQISSTTNKLGESLSKMTLKDEATLDSIQTSQYDHSGMSVTTASVTLSLPSATITASLSTGTTTISSTSTATSIMTTSRVTLPSTSKVPPNLPPGVPLMGQYIMGQSTCPPFYSVQPPLYGYEDMQLLQQRMPLQAGSYYDLSGFPAQAGSTLPSSRDQQATLSNIPFTGQYEPFLPITTGTTADAAKLGRMDVQSPNSAGQPQNAHSATQQPLINFHYGYYYPSMFPGGGLQYPMFPIPPVTNSAAHTGTTANTQFQKSYASHVYTTKGYDDLNQAQDFSKTGYGSSPTGGKTSGARTVSSDMASGTYSKSHAQTYDKQSFHGGTPPPFSLPIASATQAGPMGTPTTPYAAAPFLPIMAAHQLHHPIQQDSGNPSTRGLSQTGNQAKSVAGKSYGAPYWNT